MGIQVWDFAGDLRPAEVAVLLAGVMAGRKLDPTWGMDALESASIEADWRGLSSRYPADFTCSPAEMAASYRYEAGACERRRDWAEVQRWYDQVLALDAGRADDWLGRALAHQRQNHWEQAARDYARAAELGATDMRLWTNKAFVHRRLHQHDEALRAANKALAVDAG